MEIQLERVKVKSTIIAVGYDKDSHRMRVRFESGATYDYANTPERVFLEMLQCSNPTNFLNKTVKSDPVRNPCTRVDKQPTGCGCIDGMQDEPTLFANHERKLES